MTADEAIPVLVHAEGDDARWSAAAARTRGAFEWALGIALGLHLLVLVVLAYTPGSSRSFDTSAEDNALSVSLVIDEPVIPGRLGPTPGRPPPQLTEPPAEPKPPEPEAPVTPEPPAKPQAAADPLPPEKPVPAEPTAAPPEAAPVLVPNAQPAEKPTPKPAEKQVALKPGLDTSEPNLLKIDPTPAKRREAEAPKPPPAKSAPAKSAPTPTPKPTRQASLDLNLSPSRLDALGQGGGRAAAFSRPAGTTKSPENDAFARAVINAMRGTMPDPNGSLGSVLIRVLLNEKGNVTDVAVLRGAGDAMLDQNVAFAARQTSYPIPPTGSNTADRTFLVNYVYR